MPVLRYLKKKMLEVRYMEVLLYTYSTVFRTKKHDISKIKKVELKTMNVQVLMDLSNT